MSAKRTRYVLPPGGKTRYVTRGATRYAAGDPFPLRRAKETEGKALRGAERARYCAGVSRAIRYNCRKRQFRYIPHRARDSICRAVRGVRGTRVEWFRWLGDSTRPQAGATHVVPPRSVITKTVEDGGTTEFFARRAKNSLGSRGHGCHQIRHRHEGGALFGGQSGTRTQDQPVMSR